MIELQENSRILQVLKEKIHELGESLWHREIKKTIKKFRNKNYGRKLLEWQ